MKTVSSEPLIRTVVAVALAGTAASVPLRTMAAQTDSARASPAAARGDSAPRAWITYALTAGALSSRRHYYQDSPTLGARLGFGVRVASPLAVRADAQYSKALIVGGDRICLTSFPGECSGSVPIGSLWGADAGVAYVRFDSRERPQTELLVAPGVFEVLNNDVSGGRGGFGMKAELRQAIHTGLAGGLTMGIGVLAIFNVNHDTVIHVPFEIGGWSW